jgi:hypothetical protein
LNDFIFSSGKAPIVIRNHPAMENPILNFPTHRRPPKLAPKIISPRNSLLPNNLRQSISAKTAQDRRAMMAFRKCFSEEFSIFLLSLTPYPATTWNSKSEIRQDFS